MRDALWTLIFGLIFVRALLWSAGVTVRSALRWLVRREDSDRWA